MRYYPTEEQYYKWRDFWNSPEGVLFEAFLRERGPTVDRTTPPHVFHFDSGRLFQWGDMVDEITRWLSDEGMNEAMGKTKEEE